MEGIEFQIKNSMGEIEGVAYKTMEEKKRKPRNKYTKQHKLMKYMVTEDNHNSIRENMQSRLMSLILFYFGSFFAFYNFFCHFSVIFCHFPSFFFISPKII